MHPALVAPRPPGAREIGPRCFVLDDFVAEAELVRLRALADDGATTAAADAAGLRAELPVAGPLVALRARIEALAGFRSVRRDTVRFRHYAVGEGHPRHSDTYAAGDAQLVATALLALEDAVEGGETVFGDGAAHVAPRAGRLVLWWTLDAEGRVDPAADHAALPVRAGRKRVLLFFLYARTSRARRLVLLHDGAPEDTRTALRLAAAGRGLGTVEVDARRERGDGLAVGPGDLVVNAGLGGRAVRLEGVFVGAGAVSLVDDALFTYRSGPLVFERAGLPVPRTVHVVDRSWPALDADVARLGGYPVVVKVLGLSGGVGVLRADSRAGLRSLLDLLDAEGRTVVLVAFVPDAVHWRVIVVDDRVVAAYRNPLGPDGFRSQVTAEENLHGPPPDDVADLARAATRAVRVGFAGVDVLVHAPSGRAFVLEANHPCWFGLAEEVGGADVAGAIVDALERRATTTTVSTTTVSGTHD